MRINLFLFLLLFLPLFTQNKKFSGVLQKAVSTKGLLLDFFLGPCKCKCGVPNRESRLLGGEFLRTYEFPWMATLHVKDTLKAPSIPATLINDRFVITGASRVVGLTPFDLKLTIGLYDRCLPETSSSNVSVEKIIIHPDFNLESQANDLALLKLTSPLNLNRRVSTVCLSVPGNNYLGQVATLSGWEEKSSPDGAGAASTCRPRKLGLPVLGSKECLENSKLKHFGPDKGCLGIVGASSVVCKVDAGGPVIYRSHYGIYELIGILTNSNECDDEPQTVTYTKINNHLPWITDHTRGACYCSK